MTPRQCRMARAGLGWTLDELARAAEVSVNTVHRLEEGGGVMLRTLEKVQRALVGGGIVFHSNDTVSLPAEHETAPPPRRSPIAPALGDEGG